MSNPRFNFFLLIWRNLKSRPLRTVLTIVIFTLITGALFSSQYLITGAEHGLSQGTTWMGADLIVVPGSYNEEGETSILTNSPSTFFFNDSGFEDISRIPGVAQASPQILVATLGGQACCSGLVQIVAVDPARDFTLAPWLRSHPEVQMGRDDIVVGNKIDGDIGSELKFYGHNFRIVGRLDPTGMMGVDMAIFTRIEDVNAMAVESGEKAAKPLVIPAGEVSSVLVKVEPGLSPIDIGNEISRRIPGTKVITAPGLLATVTLRLADITRLLFGSVVLVSLLAIPLLAIMSLMVAHELKKEIALLGALGVTKTFVLQLVLAETFISAVIGSLIGIGSSFVILVGFQDFIAFSFRIPFFVPPPLTILAMTGSTLLLTLVIAGIASLYPTVRLVRSEMYGKIRGSGPEQ